MAEPTPRIVQFVAVLGALAWGLAPDRLVPWPTLRVREVLRRDQLNEADYVRMERGYYEDLLDAGRQLGATAGPGGAGRSSTVNVSGPASKAGANDARPAAPGPAVAPSWRPASRRSS